MSVIDGELSDRFKNICRPKRLQIGIYGDLSVGHSRYINFKGTDI